MSEAVLVANRFVALSDGTYLDLASATTVSLTRCTVSDDVRATVADEGARLCRLWHPVLAPYLDFGPLGEGDWFEAVATVPLSVTPVTVVRRADVEAFLHAHDLRLVTLVESSFEILQPSLLVRRPPAPGSIEVESTIRGFGTRLIEPRILSTLMCWLEEPLDTGPHVWSIDAPAQCGWRTCWSMLARDARRLGFVPIDAELLARAVRGPAGATASWLSSLRDRPLLVAHCTETWNETARHQLAALVMVVGGLHKGISVVLDVVREGRPHQAQFAVEPFHPFTLARSVWTGVPRLGQRRLRALAARANGRPGAFVARIGRILQARESASCVVHERPPVDAIYARPLETAAVDRLLTRVEGLEARGRHAAARRHLRRERAALERRGQLVAGLHVWAALAIREVRTGSASAIADWARAWRKADEHGDPRLLLEAIPAVACAWIRDAAVVPAERLLRAAIAAAAAEEVRPPPMVTVLLAESLYWQDRLPEMRGMLADCSNVLAPVLRARAALRCGDEPLALRGAVDALTRARDLGDQAAMVMALAVRLRIDAVIGDLDHLTATTDAVRLLPISVGTLAEDEATLSVAESWTFLRRDWPEGIRAEVIALTAPTRPRLVRGRARTVLALAGARSAHAVVLGDVRQAAIATGARALLPAAAPCPPWPEPPESKRSFPMVQDIVSILQACQQDDEPTAVVRRVASIVRERTASTGVAVFTAEDCGLVARARFGRPPGTRLGERVAALRSAIGPEQESGIWEAAWPILHREVLTGAIVCQWGRLTTRPAADVVSIAATAAAALGPVVDLLRAPPVPPSPPSGAIAELLGSSDAIGRVRAAIDRAALAPFSVVIEGESGAGKELVARAIHERSPRRARAFCAVNCAALTDELFEAELFGHARGAFTGAITDRAGLFEEADGGTLFLDEVIELSGRAQAKLLRALQEGEIRRIGETRPRRVDVRVIAAANRSLLTGVAAGSFRADLRFRLEVLRIEVPALRARPDDITELARHFWARAAARVGSRAVLGPDALAAFARYDWPGNVRELQNALAALAVGAPARGIVRASALPAQICIAESGVALTLDEARRRFEAGFVRAAIARAGGSKGRAAADLGVTRQGLAKLLDRLGLDVERQEPECPQK
jgi:transcriptional regulator with AAA-type ATPase domain